MTTPTTMITSMITTATTMMIDVGVASSLGRLLVGCVLLLTGTVPVVIFSPSLLVGCRLLQIKKGVIVASSLLVNCVLLLTGTVTAVEGEVVPPVWGGARIDPVEGNTQHDIHMK